MNVNIRPYQAKDQKMTEHLQGLLQDHVAHLDPIKNYRYLKDFDAKKYCKLTLKNIKQNQGAIFLATDKERVIGLVIGIIYKYDKNDLIEHYSVKKGHILELIVLNEYRNKKIGTKLLQAIEEYFTKKKCQAIQVDCFATNKNAYKFYLNSKYQDRLVTLFKTIPHSSIPK